MFNKKPQYDYQITTHNDRQVLCITDMYSDYHPCVTVTNAVEQVLEEIKAQLPHMPALIIYRDTDGYWDQIHTNEQGQFSHFSTSVRGGRTKLRPIALEGVTTKAHYELICDGNRDSSAEGGYRFACNRCSEMTPIMCDPSEFEPEGHYCGRDPRCCP